MQARALRAWLASQEVTDAYHARIDAIHRKLANLWSSLVHPSEYQDLVLWMLAISAEQARLAEVEEIA